jgi:hypothetical protein
MAELVSIRVSSSGERKCGDGGRDCSGRTHQQERGEEESSCVMRASGGKGREHLLSVF